MMRLAYGFLVTIVLVRAAQAQRRPPVLVVQIGQRLDVLDAASKRLWVFHDKYAGYGAFSVDRAAAVAVAVQPICHYAGGGELFLFQRSRRNKITLPGHILPGPYVPGEIEVYADPAVSPSGTFVAFVVRPCNTKRRLDLVESAGLVVVLDRTTGRARVLSGSRSASGAAHGFANKPMWSPDERLLFVNFETGFRVLNGGGGTVAAEYPKPGKMKGWSSALGWIGSRCIVVTEGEDFREADRNPRIVFNLVTGNTMRLDAIVGNQVSQQLLVSVVQWPYALALLNGQLSLSRMGTGRFEPLPLAGAEGVALLAGDLNAEVPGFCRP